MRHNRVGNKQWLVLCVLADAAPHSMAAGEVWRATAMPTPGMDSMGTLRRMVERGLIRHACPRTGRKGVGHHVLHRSCPVVITERGAAATCPAKYRGRLVLAQGSVRI